MLKIAIASGKGGTGKTFLSSNLFRTLQLQGRKVALVDCDAEVPNESLFLKMEKCGERKTMMLCPEIDPAACLFCGKCAQWCSYHAVTCIPAARYIRIMPDLCHGCGACLEACSSGAVRPSEREIGIVTAFRANDVDSRANDVDSRVNDVDSRANDVDSRANDVDSRVHAAAPSGPVFFEARTREGVHSPVPVIRDAIAWAASAEAEYTIFDAPPGCACPFVNTVIEADKVVLITEPTPFGLSDLKHTVDVLRSLHKDFGVVLNRSDLGDGQMKAYLEAGKIPLLGEIPYSPAIASIYARGELAVDADAAFFPLFAGLWEKIIQL